ncbi:hypothetical protein K1719_046866 [Acacia pycnantha]|nr:hypothetical protein K1719_046866 [Acacia pycnantha]
MEIRALWSNCPLKAQNRPQKEPRAIWGRNASISENRLPFCIPCGKRYKEADFSGNPSPVEQLPLESAKPPSKGATSNLGAETHQFRKTVYHFVFLVENDIRRRISVEIRALWSNCPLKAQNRPQKEPRAIWGQKRINFGKPSTIFGNPSPVEQLPLESAKPPSKGATSNLGAETHKFWKTVYHFGFLVENDIRRRISVEIRALWSNCPLKAQNRPQKEADFSGNPSPVEQLPLESAKPPSKGATSNFGLETHKFWKTVYHFGFLVENDIRRRISVEIRALWSNCPLKAQNRPQKEPRAIWGRKRMNLEKRLPFWIPCGKRYKEADFSGNPSPVEQLPLESAKPPSKGATSNLGAETHQFRKTVYHFVFLVENDIRRRISVEIRALWSNCPLKAQNRPQKEPRAIWGQKRINFGKPSTILSHEQFGGRNASISENRLPFCIPCGKRYKEADFSGNPSPVEQLPLESAKPPSKGSTSNFGAETHKFLENRLPFWIPCGKRYKEADFSGNPSPVEQLTLESAKPPSKGATSNLGAETHKFWKTVYHFGFLVENDIRRRISVEIRALWSNCPLKAQNRPQKEPRAIWGRNASISENRLPFWIPCGKRYKEADSVEIRALWSNCPLKAQNRPQKEPRAIWGQKRINFGKPSTIFGNPSPVEQLPHESAKPPSKGATSNLGAETHQFRKTVYHFVFLVENDIRRRISVVIRALWSNCPLNSQNRPQKEPRAIWGRKRINLENRLPFWIPCGKRYKEADFSGNPSPVEQLPLESAKPPSKGATSNLGAETHQFRKTVYHFVFLVENDIRRRISVEIRALWSNCPLKAQNRPQKEPRAIWGQKRINFGKPSTIFGNPSPVEQLPLESAKPPSKGATSNLGAETHKFWKTVYHFGFLVENDIRRRISVEIRALWSNCPLKAQNRPQKEPRAIWGGNASISENRLPFCIPCGKRYKEADFSGNPSPVEQLPLESAKPPSKGATSNLGAETHKFWKTVYHFGFLVENDIRRRISVEIRALWSNCPLKAQNRPQKEPRAIWGQKRINFGKPSTIFGNPSPVEQLPLESAKPPSKGATSNLGAETHQFRKTVYHFGFLVENDIRRLISVEIRALWSNCPLKAQNRPQKEPRAIWGRNASISENRLPFCIPCGKRYKEADFSGNPSPVEQLPLESAKPPSKGATSNLGAETHKFWKTVYHFGFLVENDIRRRISVEIRALWSNCPLKAQNRPQKEPRAIWGQKRINFGKPSTILDSLWKTI